MIGSGYTAMLERDRTIEAAADAIIHEPKGASGSFCWMPFFSFLRITIGHILNYYGSVIYCNLEFCARNRKQALNTGCMIRRGLQ